MNYYVDLVRAGRQITLLAGPFVSEDVARRYQQPAFEAALALDPLVAFDRYGVVAMEDFCLPGLLNDQLAIRPYDLAFNSADLGGLIH